MTWTTISTVSVDTVISPSTFGNLVKADLDHLYANLEWRALHLHCASTVTNGNAIAWGSVTSLPFAGAWYQSAAADADSFTFNVVLAPGSYTMYILGQVNANGGKIDWTQDGGSIATAQDWYAGSAASATKTIAITVSEGGRIVFQGTVNGKNASSGGYQIPISAIWFKQASDS